MQLLEELREEVREEELVQFDTMVEPTRNRVVEAVNSFLQIDPAMTLSTGEEHGCMLLLPLFQSLPEVSAASQEPSEEYMMVNMRSASTHSSEMGAGVWLEMEQVSTLR